MSLAVIFVHNPLKVLVTVSDLRKAPSVDDMETLPIDLTGDLIPEFDMENPCHGIELN